MLVYGLPSDSIAAAAKDLPFVPVASAILGDPIQVFASDPTEIPLEQRAIDLKYDHPTYGRFDLIEQLSQTTQEELEVLASDCDPNAGCEGSWTTVKIRDAITALLVQGQGSTLIAWLDGPVRFEVRGPPDTFSAENAVAVANEV